MDNLALQLIDEVTEQEGFMINDDFKAEWALKKIAEEKKELQKTELLIDSMVAEYQFKKQQAQERYQNKVRNLENMLIQYFETVDKKKTKTQETYQLPSGTLKRKFGTIEYERDAEILLAWLKKNNRTDLVKVKEEPKWAELKKEVCVLNNKVVNTDGEIIDGVIATKKQDTFEIEF